MCGIAGIVHIDGSSPPNEKRVRAMIATMRHRGPDGEGFWTSGPLSLGHCRLAIRDLTPDGAQPFFSADGNVVVAYNGEIYNHVALAQELAKATGFTQRTRCDTELIPAAYQAWGLDAFSRLEGMFAFALWDRRAQRLVLARDGIGIKPLYLWQDASEIGFASEIKGVLAGRTGERKLCPSDLAHMLALGYTAPDRALIEGVRQLPAGTIFVHDREGTTERRYWSPTRNPQAIGRREARDGFIHLFREVVDQQLVSDVPVGIMQSGGIDSSLVSMSLPPRRDIPLFSVRFNEATYNEANLVELVAGKTNRPIVWVDLPAGADVEADFRTTVHAVDGHLSDSSTLAVLLLCRALRRHVTVALSGDGGDEFFAGYSTYAASVAADRLRGIAPSAMWSLLARATHASSGIPSSRLTRREKLYRFLAGLGHAVPHATWRHYLAPWRRSELYGPALADELRVDPFQGYAASLGADGDLIDRCMRADQTYYLPADMLVKVDRASMAESLEVRVPFLDRRVVDFASTLPLATLRDGGQGKRVLREALAHLGGTPDLVQSAKRGFNLPMNTILRGGLKSLGTRLLCRDADIFSPYLSSDAVRKVWKDHKEGRRDEKYLIWTLLTLGIWFEKAAIA